MTRSIGISAVVLTSPVRSVAPNGRRAAAKEGAVEERDGEADFRAGFNCNTIQSSVRAGHVHRILLVAERLSFG